MATGISQGRATHLLTPNSYGPRGADSVTTRRGKAL